MFADPQKNIDQLGLAIGAQVADMGSGSGFYTLAAARAVTGSGRVYSIDIQKDLLSRIKVAADKEKLFNIEIIWGDVEKIGGTRLGDASVDAIIISNLLFQITNKDIFIKEAKRILKKRGKALVVDWMSSFGGIGPKPDEVVTEKKATELFAAEGFAVEKNFSAGEHHYGIVFRR